MDVTATRARNIAMLVEQTGGPTAFGKLIERDQVQVSQWTSASKPKPIGGRLARYIESKLGRSVGWLDQPQWNRIAEPASEYRSQPLRLDPEIVRDVARALQEVYSEELGRAYSIVEEPELFVEMYERTVARGEVDSRSNMVWLGSRIGMAQQGSPVDERKGVHGQGHGSGKTGGRKAKA